MTIHSIIYDRASTLNQRDNFSRVNAREVGIRIAEQNGFSWEYLKEIGSGTTLTGRPEMMRILDRIAAGEVQALIVQELDRLARPEDAVIYDTIRRVIMKYGVIIYTHTGRIDLNNDDDDFVADITMSVAIKERRRILKRMERGLQSRAESGKFIGHPGLGYRVVGFGSNSDLEIEPEGAKLVRLIFDVLEDTGGNSCETARQINGLGYTGDRGKPFTAKTIRQIAARKRHLGISESVITDKVSYRPDLQIISVDQFNRVREMVKERKTGANPKTSSNRGRYILTGFVVCGTCGGSMVAVNRSKTGRNIAYQCINRRLRGEAGCSASKTYSERLILPPVVDFIARLIQEQINIRLEMLKVAAQYGKSVTEEALESAIAGELESVRAGKQRLVEAITLGVLTTQEAAAKLTELREHEQRLMVEVASITEKTAITEQWQQALDSLEGQTKEEIAHRLYFLAEKSPIAFRRFLGLVFEPNSLQARTERINRPPYWAGYLEGYQLTEAIKMLQKQYERTVSFGTKSDNKV